MRNILVLFLVTIHLTALNAQVLNDFSAFGDRSTTDFNGNWGNANNDPIASFSQGSGVYNLVGGTNDNFAGADYYFASPVDLGGNRMLALSAMLLPGNVATSIQFRLTDTSSNVALAKFEFSSFSTVSYTVGNAALTPVSGAFNWGSVDFFSVSGAMQSGADPINISFDSLTAVPEPATYAAILGFVTLGLVSYRRFRRR